MNSFKNVVNWNSKSYDVCIHTLHAHCTPYGIFNCKTKIERQKKKNKYTDSLSRAQIHLPIFSDIVFRLLRMSQSLGLNYEPCSYIVLPVAYTLTYVRTDRLCNFFFFF